MVIPCAIQSKQPFRWTCDVCRRDHNPEDRKHHCVECMGKLEFFCLGNNSYYILDFDLCIECVSLPPDQQNVDSPEGGNHNYEHLLMCQSLQFEGQHAVRTAWEAKLALEKLREASSAARRSTLPATNDSVCGSCSAIISEDPRFYICLVRSCRGTF